MLLWENAFRVNGCVSSDASPFEDATSRNRIQITPKELTSSFLSLVNDAR